MAPAEGDGLAQCGWYTAVVEEVTARRARVRATAGAHLMLLDEVAVNRQPEEPPFRHAALGRPVTAAHPPGGNYSSTGVQGLTDGFVAPSPDSLNLQCLGFDKNLDATIDLGRELDIREVGAHFLQDDRVGVRIPAEMNVLVSSDGKEFRTVAIAKHTEGDRPVCMATLSAKLKDVTGRYVRVVAPNRSHWLFADEVFVNPEPGAGRQD